MGDFKGIAEVGLIYFQGSMAHILIARGVLDIYTRSYL